MIVLKPHPADPARWIFIPLRYDRQGGSWVAIRRRGKPVAFTSDREAILCVLEHAVEEWSGVLHGSRVVRIVSEHDEGPGAIDIEVVRREARDLATLADQFDETLKHLLSQPDAKHRVELDVDKLVVVDDQADDLATAQSLWSSLDK